MALVNECDEILREIIQQAEWSHAFCAAVKVSRIVLDARAVSHFLYELKVILDSLLEPLGFMVLADALEVFALSYHVVLDLADRLCAAFFRGHEVAGRVDRDLVKLFDERSGERVDDGELLHFVSEELHANGILTVSDADVDSVSAHPECSSLEVGLCPIVKCIDQLVQEPCHASFLTTFDVNCLVMEVGRVSDTV